MIRKISYTGNSKVIQRLCEAVNSLIDSIGTSEIKIVKTGSTSSMMYPTVTGNNWVMGRADNTCYYDFFNVKDYVDLKLTTSGGTRTRVVLTDMEPSEFQTSMSGGTAFTVTGSYAHNCDTTETDFPITNSSTKKYLYVYHGNSQGTAIVMASSVKPSGSDVSVTPIQQTGTNIADITVNGNVNHIYSPNGGALVYGNDGHIYIDYDLIEGE